VILIAISLTAYYFFFRVTVPEPDFVVAAKRDIAQEVSLTGRVKPASSVDLAFERSGKIDQVNANVGRKVGAGETLAVLVNAGLRAEVLQAEANLEAEEIKLAELKRGARPEEIAVSRAKVASAESAELDAKNNLVDKLKDAYTKSDDAVRNKVDQFFDSPASADPRLSTYLNADSGLERKTEEERALAGSILKTWKTSLDALSNLSDLNAHIAEAKKNLNQTVLFLDKAALVVNSSSAGAGLSQATLDGWRADIATARTNVNTAISNLSSAEEKLRIGESNLLIASRELELKESGAASEEILAAEAKVKSAEAVKQQKNAELAKTILLSPIAGIVTKADAKVGEIVSQNTVLVSVISIANFEIEANSPEADVAKLKVGAKARVTLDAYGDEFVFDAEIISIDPAETIVEGVSTYKTKLAFLKEDARIKSGMTADIDVFGERRANVLALPARAIATKAGEKFVKVLVSSSQKEIKIETGLRGSDGMIEIISGLAEGDKVVISP